MQTASLIELKGKKPLALGCYILFFISFISCHPNTPSSPPANLKYKENPFEKGLSDKPPVALVNGHPIYMDSVIEMALSSKQDPEIVLNTLIIQEAIFQKAIKEKGMLFASPLVYEKALVSFFLEDRFIKKLSPEDVAYSDIEEMWKMAQVRAKFDHLTLFFIADFQWICCDGKMCSNPESLECFRQAEIGMQILYDKAQRLDLEPDEFPYFLDDMRIDMPQLGFQEYEFAVDMQKGIQKGRFVFDDAIVQTAIKTPKGSFSKPVKSAFGWHCLYVKDIIPEEHKDLSDPDVRNQISTLFINRFRALSFYRLLATLIPLEKFKTLADIARNAKISSPSPLWDVMIFDEALQEIAKKKEEVEGL